MILLTTGNKMSASKLRIPQSRPPSHLKTYQKAQMNEKKEDLLFALNTVVTIYFLLGAD